MKQFCWPVRVYYEDTDAGGVVYYANYLRYMERARTEWLRSIGVEQGALRGDAGLLFVVRSAHLEYHRAARFDDLLEVRSRIRARRAATIEFEQVVYRVHDDLPLCSGAIQVACVRADSFRPTSIPKGLLGELTGDR